MTTMQVQVQVQERPAFTTGRADGRSDKQVIVDLVADAVPDTVYGYAGLLTVLAEGLAGAGAGAGAPLHLVRVYRAVASANRVLLRQHGRYLGVVRGVGYRVLQAKEHLTVAVQRENKARRQFRAGMEVLKGAREEDLTATELALRNGMLLVTGAFVSALDAQDRRLNRHEKLIEDLKLRMDAAAAAG